MLESLRKLNSPQSLPGSTKSLNLVGKPIKMAIPTGLARTAVCTPGTYQFPDAPPGQSVTFCAVSISGNRTAVLQTCCKETRGTITNSTDGCSVYCITGSLRNDTEACLEKNSTPAFCAEIAPIAPTTITSSNSPTRTATPSAVSPSKSTGPASPKLGSALLGLMLLLGVSMAVWA